MTSKGVQQSLTTQGSVGILGRAGRTVLSDRYSLGEELGRGAYGQVFKGIDLITNEPVAIKQISLAGMSTDNLQGVQGEIELLKTLNHANIVKYIGSFKTRTHLYIILEFMEGGALSAIIKPGRMGLFPEKLVAVYIAQVLQGLQYLHEQGVVHRDIKGANILTDKNLVKLADFGVAARLGELEDRRDELHQHVVGTPYWMAPEVIEMTQVTPASDIWSVGCLIVELLTGSPPYYELQPMSALFRIVQDDCPPLPDGVSPLMQDFLQRCFQKDPRRRPGANELLAHEWIRQSCLTLRSSWRRNGGGATAVGGAPGDHESVASVISRMVALTEEGTDPIPGTSAAPPPVSPSQVGVSMPADLQRRPSLSPLRDGALATGAVPPPAAAADAVAIATAAAAVASGTSTPPPQGPLAAGAAPAGVPLPPLPQYPQVPAGADAQGPSTPPLAGPITSLISMLGNMPQPTGGQLAPWLQDADRMVLVSGSRAAAGASGQQGGAVAGSSGLGPGAGGQAHWDARNGMAPGENGAVFELGPTANSAMLDLRRQVRELVRALRPVPGGTAARDPNGMSPAAACHALATLVATSPDAKQLMMTETGALVLLELLDTDNAKNVEGAMELLMAITNQDLVTLETICLLGVVPASAKYALPPYPASLRLRTAGFLARFFNSGPSTLAHFVACQGLKQLVAMVADLPVPKTPVAPGANPTSGYAQAAALLPLMAIQADSPGLALSQVAISCIFQFLDCYNILPHNYLCRLLAQNGLVPRLYVVLKETIVQLARPQSSTARNSSGAANTTTSPTSPGYRGTGYSTLDAKQARAALNQGLGSPTNVRAGFQTVDSRTFRTTKEAVAEEPTPLVVPVLTHEELAALQEAAVGLLLLLSNADTMVKGYCCTRDNLQHHLDCLGRLAPPSLIRLMRALRWLTCEHAMLPAIKDSGAIAVLVPFLAKERLDLGGLPAAQVQIEALHALYNICKFNKVHLEAAATVGITPHLCRMAADGINALTQQHHQHGPPSQSSASATPRSQQGPGTPQAAPDEELLNPLARWGRLRGFVVPLMIALVATSSSTRARLWNAGGPDLFLALLSDPDSVELGVPGALELWLAEDHARMEPKLTQREPVAQIVALYARIAQAQDTSVLPALLSVLRAMIGRSSKLAVALALGPQGIVPCLLALIDRAAPILRVKILEIIRCLYEHYPRPKEFLLLHRIQEVLVRLLESGGRGADAVHQEAQRLLTAFQINVLF